MQEAENVQYIKPNDAQIEKSYKVVFSEVHIKTVMSKDGQIFLNTPRVHLLEGDTLVATRSLDNLAQVGGYTLFYSRTVFVKIGSIEEFLLPNIPCLDNARSD